MTDALFCQDFVYSNQNAGFFYITETIVNGSTEHTHSRTQTHVSIHQRRNVIPQLTYLTIQYFIVFLKGILTEQSSQILLLSFHFKRFHRSYQIFLIPKMFLQEIKNHVSSLTMITWIHSYFTKEILHIGHYHRQCS